MEPVSRLSNSRSPRKEGAVPLSVKGLYLSKVEMREPATRRSSPPLGACGFTYSKWLKPGAYLKLPHTAYPGAPQHEVPNKEARNSSKNRMRQFCTDFFTQRDLWDS